MPESKNEKRGCFYIQNMQDIDRFGGITPSWVTENEPGYSSLGLVWGRTMKDAKKRCQLANENLGLSEHDVARIVASSLIRRKDK